MAHDRKPENQSTSDTIEKNSMLNKPLLLNPLVSTIFKYTGCKNPHLDHYGEALSITTIYTELADHELHTLFLHIVRGKQNQAEEIIKLNPELLLKTHRVTDYSGRVIEGTALQVALGAEDDDMCKMISRYLDHTEILKQYKIQFADDHPIHNNKRDIQAVHKIFKAIFYSNKNDDCTLELQRFRDYLKPKSVIKNGKHFNTNMLVKAYKLYDLNFECSGGLNSRKNILFWHSVIGYLQRFLPACYAQAYCQGFYALIEEKMKLNRSLKFRYGGGSYFPLDTNPTFKLGYDFTCSPGYQSGPARRYKNTLHPRRRWSTMNCYLMNYIGQKQRRLDELCKTRTSNMDFKKKL